MFELKFLERHLYLSLGDQLWLFDTGAPQSFGEGEKLSIMGKEFPLASSFMGLDANKVSEHAGVEMQGLLGADIINHFDYRIDVQNEYIEISEDEIEMGEPSLQIKEFMAIPILTAEIGGAEYSMFFDSGAQYSYFQEDELSSFPPLGKVADFYPGVGPFETDTFSVPMNISSVDISTQCGKLPDLLAMTLSMADTSGIIGNELLIDRVVTYSPRRNVLSL
jgi:hypothetical protein